MALSHIDQVKQFTEQSKDMKCPESPVPLNEASVKFIVRMVLSELAELYQTINPTASKLSASAYLMQSKFQRTIPVNLPLADNQCNTFKDIISILNSTALKYNMPFNEVFDAVHAANMNKRWADGNFHRRPEDGKVIKPDGWQEADLTAVIAPFWNVPESDQPKSINYAIVSHIIDRIIPRLAYLIDITMPNTKFAAEFVLPECAALIDYTHRPNAANLDKKETVEAQIDALIDVYYYILDTMAKHGMTI